MKETNQNNRILGQSKQKSNFENMFMRHVQQQKASNYFDKGSYIIVRVHGMNIVSLNKKDHKRTMQ